ncbi:MAG: hypothetical protein WD431_05810 [Cyclobacteriaceae bacterium]
MNTHSDKTQRNKSQSNANGGSRKQHSGEATFQFMNNRPEAIAQRKLHELANNSLRAMQLSTFQDMANNSPKAKQAVQFQRLADNYSDPPKQFLQKKKNITGLQDNLKTGKENLSGISLQAKGGSMPGKVIQRLNGAVPQNFRVTNTASNDADCSVTTDLDWDSSVGGKNNLADFQTREIITFNAAPTINMPCYAGPLPAGMQIAGNILTKPIGPLSNPGASDKHTGVGHAPKFTVGGIPNLQRGAWQLVGTQYYQYKQDGNPGWVNAAGPFVITRTMVQNGDDFSLTISKVGPNCMVSAGPTPITMETSTAMDMVGGARVDQTGEWNAAQATLIATNANKPALNFNAIATDVRNNALGVPFTTDYEYTSCANAAHPFAAAYDIPQAWRDTIYQKARTVARGIVENVLTGANPPTQFIITIFRCAGVQQQALWTNENGGTYRVLLRADKLMDMGQWGGDVDTSLSGRESKRGWTDQGKKERFTKGAATHELGHMLHAIAAPNKFLTSTLMPANIVQIQNAVPADPLADEKIHICRVNGRIIQALNAKGYKQKWGYAMNNPGEVVPEVFTAIQHDRTVPKGLAAVYVAYGGHRGGNIDAALQTSFGGAIPAIPEPEDAIPIINS